MNLLFAEDIPMPAATGIKLNHLRFLPIDFAKLDQTELCKFISDNRNSFRLLSLMCVDLRGDAKAWPFVKRHVKARLRDGYVKLEASEDCDQVEFFHIQHGKCVAPCELTRCNVDRFEAFPMKLTSK